MIRLVEARDVEKIISGELEVFKKTLGTMLYGEINSSYGRYYLMEIDDEFIGYIGLRVLDQVEVMNFYILPKYQGKGYGNELLEYVCNLVDKRNKEMILEVRKSNEKAIKLYEKFGFKNIRIIKKYYDGVEDAIVMLRGVKNDSVGC